MNSKKQEAYIIFNEIVKLVESKFGVDLIDDGWVLYFNKRKSSWGLCDYAKKTIFLSEVLLSEMTTDMMQDTIIHEIAHALNPNQHHNGIWKNTCIMLGGSGKVSSKSLSDEKLAQIAKYKLVNTLNGEVIKYFMRRPTRDYSRFYVAGDLKTRGMLKVQRV